MRRDIGCGNSTALVAVARLAVPLSVVLVGPAEAAVAARLSDQEILDRIGAAVVEVVTLTSRGTGFVLNAQGHVATNRHVVEGKDSVAVRQRERMAPAEVVWSAAGVDLAVVRTGIDGVGAVVLGLSPPTALADVVAVGFPGVADTVRTGGMAEPTFSTGSVGRGIVMGSWNGRDSLRIVQHSAEFNPGSSGGPLVDACGRVVGVNTSYPAAVVERTADGELIDAPSGVYWASFIGELAEELDALGIPYESSAKPCAGAPAEATPTSVPREGAGRLASVLLAAAGAILVLAGAVFFAFASFRRSVGELAAQIRQGVSRAPNEHRRTGKPANVGRRIRIGRGRGMDVRLRSAKVSRHHADLDVVAGGYRLTDRGSTNGTRVLRDGRWQAIRRSEVAPDERLELGDFRATAAELERLATPAGEGDGAQPRAVADSRPAGQPVRRNRRTGEVIGEPSPPT